MADIEKPLPFKLPKRDVRDLHEKLQTAKQLRLVLDGLKALGVDIIDSEKDLDTVERLTKELLKRFG